MANLDEIFTSDLDENKKKSKMIFGKLLLSLRKNNQFRLYSLMSEVIDTDCKDNKLVMIVGDKSSFEMLGSKEDSAAVEKDLQKIAPELTLEVFYEEVKKFDMYKFEEFLKSEFGKILTIK